MQQLDSAFFTIEEGKGVKRRSVAETVSCVRIDVRSNERHIFLRKGIERRTGRKDPAEELVTAFDMRFLPGSHGIAVENSGAKRTVGSGFDCGRVGELGAVIRKDRGKEGTEIVMTETVVEEIDPVLNRLCSIRVAKEDGHEIPGKSEGQKDLGGTCAADNAVHLNRKYIGMQAQEFFIVIQRATGTAAFVDLSVGFLTFSGFKPALSGKIDISRLQSAFIDETIRRTP